MVKQVCGNKVSNPKLGRHKHRCILSVFLGWYPFTLFSYLCDCRDQKFSGVDNDTWLLTFGTDPLGFLSYRLHQCLHLSNLNVFLRIPGRGYSFFCYGYIFPNGIWRMEWCPDSEWCYLYKKQMYKKQNWIETTKQGYKALTKRRVL